DGVDPALDDGHVRALRTRGETERDLIRPLAEDPAVADVESWVCACCPVLPLAPRVRAPALSRPSARIRVEAGRSGGDRVAERRHRDRARVPVPAAGEEG